VAANSYFKGKTVKNISLKMAEGKNEREILTPFFWTFFWTFINVLFGLCVPSILKHESKTSKIVFVTIMLSKCVFGLKKL